MAAIKTRFAPSPTGYLHVGGARTALYSWLYAQKNKGDFVLRIEDTDLERSTEEAKQAILDGMTWLGLTWTEGPFYQTDRLERYKELIQKLLDEGKAYRCYCSKDRLEKLREDQKASGQKPKYDRYCLSNDVENLDAPHVIRFKNPDEGSVTFDDHVRGKIEISNSELDDLIIARSDGTPTYNFCVVVDDWDMGITHVVRGEDHINNTPRQINILTALGATIPEYAHVSMILGDDGAKLSKRHGAVSVMQYRDDGYLPEAVLNYLVRLGWSHGDQEIFSMQEMIDLFSLDSINKAASAFNTEKLNWLNQHYIKTLPVSQVASALSWHMDEEGIDVTYGAKLDQVIPLFAERCHTLKEMAQSCRYLYEDYEEFDPAAAKKHLRPVAKDPLLKVQSNLKNLELWMPYEIQKVLTGTAEELGVGMGKVGMPLRVAVTGAGQSPSLDQTLFLIGKEKIIQRINKAIDFIAIRENS